ncbi:hypothetical protein BH20ACI1_BH20ACI1_00620 [soil metagenome]
MRDSGVFQLSGWLKRIELAYSRSNPNIVYALFRVDVGNPPVEVNKIARSTDGGQNFFTKATPDISADWYKNTLWVSPTDSDFIVAGGYYHYKSTDGGNSFTQISQGYILPPPKQPHVDQHCIVSDPGYNGTTNKRVYVCNDGGIYRTDDITTANTVGDGGWEYISQSYQTSQYYGAAGNGLTGLIYGGTQDNGTLRLLPGSQNANSPYGGDGGFSAVDPTDDSYCYGEYIGLRIHRSIDHGVSAQSIYAGITDISDIPGENTYASFIAPFILDPNQPNRMLAGGASLWRTNNVRGNDNPNDQPTWSKIRANSNTFRITAIAVAPGNENIVWVSERDEGQNTPDNLREGRIYKTNNGVNTNPNWITIDDNVNTDPIPNRTINRILIDKDNSNVVYVAFGGFTNGNLQKTTDGGISWQDITGAGLPDVPIRGIARHPDYPNKLYVGTEIGVFRSENGGAAWDAVLDGPANVSVDELVFMSNSKTLLAATHGRGIWTNDETAPPRRTLFDFDGDGRADVSVFRPSYYANWYVDRSLTGFQAVQFGTTDDKPVARDYDGDGKADITVWRPSNGFWYRLNSSNGVFVSVQFGQQGDVLVPADFDNDGKTDEAVFRPSTKTWYLNQSTAGFTAVLWGDSTDIPSAADFDGDGKADQAMFRPSNGVWYLLQSTNGSQQIQFGQQGDLPVAADYDGDGKVDTAVFRPSTGMWHLNRSTAGFTSIPWGASTDIMVPADYDGDGKADAAVWRPTDGMWHLLQSANGYRAVQFGTYGDIPIPAMP